MCVQKSRFCTFISEHRAACGDAKKVVGPGREPDKRRSHPVRAPRNFHYGLPAPLSWVA